MSHTFSLLMPSPHFSRRLLSHFELHLREHSIRGKGNSFADSHMYTCLMACEIWKDFFYSNEKRMREDGNMGKLKCVWQPCYPHTFLYAPFNAIYYHWLLLASIVRKIFFDCLFEGCRKKKVWLSKNEGSQVQLHGLIILTSLSWQLFNDFLTLSVKFLAGDNLHCILMT